MRTIVLPSFPEPLLGEKCSGCDKRVEKGFWLQKCRDGRWSEYFLFYCKDCTDALLRETVTWREELPYESR